MFIVPEDLSWTQDKTRVVLQRSPQAFYQFAVKGQKLEDTLANKWKLSELFEKEKMETPEQVETKQITVEEIKTKDIKPSQVKTKTIPKVETKEDGKAEQKSE